MSRSKTSSKENEMFSSAFLSKVTKKNDILNHLKELHQGLSVLSQDPKERPKGLQSLATALINSNIIENSDKEIRLMAGCCLVDILRVFAPDAPYDDRELIKVFNLIIAQIRGLANYDSTSATGNKIFYIINSLSVVKSCVVVVFLAQSGLPGAESLYLSLFDSIISSIRPEHSEEIFNHMISILQSCIEESDSIDQDILDMLLKPILPSSKTENSAAYNICFSVLKRTSNCIQGPISNFINNILVGSGACDEKKSSEVADDIYPLIFELHKISSVLLLKILPNICLQLQVDDEDVRLKAVKLLGRLFASQLADYGTEFAKNFREYLGRLVDISIYVRLEAVDCAALIVRKKKQLSVIIEEHLIKRLRDGETEVRLRCLSRLIEISLEDPLILSVSSYEEMLERAKDKKYEIRIYTLTGLSRLYAKHISSCLPSLNKNISISNFTHLLNKEIWERLSKVPGALVNCWGYPEISIKHSIIQLIQTQLIPRSFRSSDNSPMETPENYDNDAHRATAWLLFYNQLSQTERNSFGSILLTKMKVRNDLKSFLSERDDSNSGNQEEANERMRRALFKLTVSLPTQTDKKTNIIEKILSIKDKHVFRLLQNAIAPDFSVKDLEKFREDLCQRVESRSVLGEYFNTLYDISSFMLVNSSVVRELIRYAKDASHHDTEIVLSFLSQIVKYFPQVFAKCSKELKELIFKIISGKSSSHHDLLLQILMIIEKSAVFLGESNTEIPNSKNKSRKSSSGGDVSDDSYELFSILLTESLKLKQPSLCEKFAHAANQISVTPKSKALVESTIKNLLSNKVLSLQNERLTCDLSVLSNLFSSSNHLNESSLIKISEFVKEVLLKNDEKQSKTTSSISNKVFAACSGVKTWCSILILISKENIIDPESIKFYCDEILEVAYKSLDTKGCALGDISITSQQDKLICREVVICTILDLLKINYVSKTLSTDRWMSLAYSFLDENANVRENVFRHYSNLIQTNPLHIKFLSYSSLFSIDDKIAPLAKQSIVFSLKRLRCTYEDLVGKAMAKEDKKLISQAEDVIPECIVPYTIYLLANLPSSCNNKLKFITTGIRHIFGALKESLKNDADNLSYLIQQVNLISKHYADIRSPNNKELDHVTQIAGQYLKENIKTVESVQPYKGNINIPHELYVRSIKKLDSLLQEESVNGEKKKTQKFIHKNSSLNTTSFKKPKIPVDDSADSSNDEISSSQYSSQRTSNRPVRAAAQKNVNYKEISETDKETIKWNESNSLKRKSSLSESSVNSFITKNQTKESSLRSKNEKYSLTSQDWDEQSNEDRLESSNNKISHGTESENMSLENLNQGLEEKDTPEKKVPKTKQTKNKKQKTIQSYISNLNRTSK